MSKAFAERDCSGEGVDARTRESGIVSIAYYHGLLADPQRISGFQELIRASVRPGDVVVEVGAGIGTFSLFAARAGASSVWAIESDPVIHVAEHIARVNGLSDRVRFLRGSAPDVEVPMPADVLIFEDFPTRLLDQKTVRLLRACADRYLKPGGKMLPSRARLMFAPVRAEPIWRSLFPLGAEASDAYGIDLSPSVGYTANAPQSTHLPEQSLAGAPLPLGEVMLHPTPDPKRLGGSGRWALSGGPLHGLAYWFELYAGADSWMNEADVDKGRPGGGVWGQVFLPFGRPITTAAGEVLEATVRVHPFPRWDSGVAQLGSRVAIRTEGRARVRQHTGQFGGPLCRTDAHSGHPSEETGGRIPRTHLPRPPAVTDRDASDRRAFLFKLARTAGYSAPLIHTLAAPRMVHGQTLSKMMMGQMKGQDTPSVAGPPAPSLPMAPWDGPSGPN